MSDTNQIIRQELLDSSNKHKRQQRKNSGEFENQISSDGSQPNPQDDMNSQKVEDEGLASDLAKTMTERPQNQHQQVNKAAVLNCDATEMQQLKILLQQRVSIIHTNSRFCYFAEMLEKQNPCGKQTCAYFFEFWLFYLAFFLI